MLVAARRKRAALLIAGVAMWGVQGMAQGAASNKELEEQAAATAARAALYGYLIGREHDAAALPQIVRQFEAYKLAADRRDIETPDVPFQMLTALDLAAWEWKAIARHAPWQMTPTGTPRRTIWVTKSTDGLSMRRWSALRTPPGRTRPSY